MTAGAVSAPLGFMLVGLGGAAGAMFRYGLTLATARFAPALPFGTLISNLAGCFLMGALMAGLVSFPTPTTADVADHPGRLLFGVGFCGAFTTLSALVVETSGFLEQGSTLLGLGYIAATLLGGFVCFFAGMQLVRLF